MTSVTETRCDAATKAPTINYGAGRLIDVLLSFQQRQLTGVVRIDVLLQGRKARRTVVLSEGEIVYAGRDIPTPHKFVTELGQYMRIGVLDTVQEFAAKRSSIQSVMRAMVEIGVLQWDEVAKANFQRSISVLKALLPIAGRVSLASGSTAFDLQCDTSAAGSIIEALQVMNKPPSRGETPASPGAKKANRSKPVVLSVDDSPVAQALVKRALGKDYEVLYSDCAIEALNILGRRSDISMLLLDLTLPGMSGLEFCRLLRGMKPYTDLPIVMLTARDGMVDRMRGRMAGTTHYLAKPINPVELAAIVEQYVACCDTDS